jgi:Zn-dependent M16 (insulinase) family peptidase
MIPTLTFEQFKAFHEKYYHPSNSRIFFYGDVDPEGCLSRIRDYLEDFEPMEVDSMIPLQPPFDKPRQINKPFPKGDGEDGSKGIPARLAAGLVHR